MNIKYIKSSIAFTLLALFSINSGLSAKENNDYSIITEKRNIINEKNNFRNDIPYSSNGEFRYVERSVLWAGKECEHPNAKKHLEYPEPAIYICRDIIKNSPVNVLHLNGEAIELSDDEHIRGSTGAYIFTVKRNKMPRGRKSLFIYSEENPKKAPLEITAFKGKLMWKIIATRDLSLLFYTAKNGNTDTNALFKSDLAGNDVLIDDLQRVFMRDYILQTMTVNEEENTLGVILSAIRRGPSAKVLRIYDLDNLDRKYFEYEIERKNHTRNYHIISYKKGFTVSYGTNQEQVYVTVTKDLVLPEK